MDNESQRAKMIWHLTTYAVMRTHPLSKWAANWLERISQARSDEELDAVWNAFAAEVNEMAQAITAAWGDVQQWAQEAGARLVEEWQKAFAAARKAGQ